MENEIWKDVKGYEGYYQVSNMGRVRSKRALVTPKDGTICQKDILLATQPTRERQYITVALCKGGQRKQVGVHRLVAQAFIPNPDNLPFVNHKDENPSNNWVGNLEWCTQEYNLQYSMERKGRSRPKYELLPVCAYTLSGEFVAQYKSVWEAIEKLKIESDCPRGVRSGIRSCCKGRTKSSHGYVWRYPDGVELPPCRPRKKSQKEESVFLRELRKFFKANGASILSDGNIKVCAKDKVYDFGQVLSADEITKMVGKK